MQEVDCSIVRTIYSEGDFRIICCETAKGEFVAKGTIPYTVSGEIKLKGTWHKHKKYGWQFSVVAAEEIMPLDTRGMIYYLTNSGIKTIGPQLAERIVRKFGRETYDIIENHPERLSEVEGIGKKRIEYICAEWQEKVADRRTMTFLGSLGFGTRLLEKIKRFYGANTEKCLRENPYRLISDIPGIGFKKADTAAQNIGFEKTHVFRLQSGLIYILQAGTMGGHCYLVRAQLISRAAELLGVRRDLLDDPLSSLAVSGDIVINENRCYLKKYYFAEEYCAGKLIEILNAEPEYFAPEFSHNDDFDETQNEAIRRALEEKASVITGGPGTGKTTITKAIVNAFEHAGLEVLLAAPTGRAAKRLSEVTKREARTIHRLLEFSKSGDFNRNEGRPLDGDILIVDESSMIDILLMEALLKAVPPEMRLLLVGDADQLPAVGPGNVFRDMIESGVIPVSRLTETHRQTEGSAIITNAHLVNNGELPSSAGSDFEFIECANAEQIAAKVVELCDSPDVQVLSPQKKGTCGTFALNQALRAKLNPGRQAFNLGELCAGIDDKVMQIKNDYEKEVFNGDIGTIYDVTDESVFVRFDGRLVSYDYYETDALILAYACTVHKSQGSEYEDVIMIISSSQPMMLERNLLYTGMTRASKHLYLVGDSKAVKKAVANNVIEQRNTALTERLKDHEKIG